MSHNIFFLTFVKTVLADIDTDNEPFCALRQVAILISRLQTTTCCDSASLPLRKYENLGKTKHRGKNSLRPKISVATVPQSVKFNMDITDFFNPSFLQISWNLYFKNPPSLQIRRCNYSTGSITDIIFGDCKVKQIWSTTNFPLSIPVLPFFIFSKIFLQEIQR